jgi:hypothetical protein
MIGCRQIFIHQSPALLQLEGLSRSLTDAVFRLVWLQAAAFSEYVAEFDLVFVCLICLVTSEGNKRIRNFQEFWRTIRVTRPGCPHHGVRKKTRCEHTQFDPLDCFERK